MSNDNGSVLKFVPKTQKSADIKPKFYFPEVYRLEGYVEIAKQKKRRGVAKLPKFVPRFPAYTFNDTEAFGFIKPKWSLITKLDPKVDNGWVVVRHHHDDSHVEGYLDSQIDRYFDQDDVYATSQVMSTEYGTFSLTHRAKVPGSPDHLLVLIFAPDNDKPYNLQERIKRPNQYTICHPDGSITYDQYLLYPFLKPAP
jgi:hypothetical protein